MGTVTKLGRFTVTSGRQESPMRDLIYGVAGVGKSTFGADSPSPIFFGEEGSLGLDVSRLPAPRAWPDVLETVELLRREKHSWKTLVIDTLDALEPLLWRKVCEDAGVRSIEDVGGGFGKGYTAALAGWQDLLRRLEELQRTTGMGLILMGHATRRTVKNLRGDDYESMSLKINEKASAFIRGWADSVLFADYDIEVRKGKPRGNAARWLYTQKDPAFDAKNRYGLPPRVELSFAEFDRLRRRPDAELAVDLRATAESLSALLKDEARRARALEALAAAKDVASLRRVISRLNATLAEQEERELAGKGEDVAPDGDPPTTSSAPTTQPAKNVAPEPATARDSASRPVASEPVAGAVPANDPPRASGSVPAGGRSAGAGAAEHAPAPAGPVDRAAVEALAAAKARAEAVVEAERSKRDASRAPDPVEAARERARDFGQSLESRDAMAAMAEEADEAFAIHTEPTAEAAPAPAGAPSGPVRVAVAAAVPGRPGEEPSTASPGPSRAWTLEELLELLGEGQRRHAEDALALLAEPGSTNDRPAVTAAVAHLLRGRLKDETDVDARDVWEASGGEVERHGRGRAIKFLACSGPVFAQFMAEVRLAWLDRCTESAPVEAASAVGAVMPPAPSGRLW